jgi:hypothetical protein
MNYEKHLVTEEGALSTILTALASELKKQGIKFGGRLEGRIRTMGVPAIKKMVAGLKSNDKQIVQRLKKMVTEEEL